MSHGSHDHHHASGGSPHDTAHFIHNLEDHDSWFRHSAEEPHHQAAHGETQAWGIVAFMAGTLGVVLVTALVVYFFMLDPLMRRQIEKVQEGREQVRGEYVSMRSTWETQLSSYEWNDPAAGKIRIPLDAAKKRIIESYAKESAAR